MDFSRLPAVARGLWRDAPRWRWTVIGAAIATVASVLTSAMATNPAQQQPTTTSTWPGAPPGGNPPGMINVTQPPDFDSDRRLRDFYQAYVNAGANKAQEGRWCMQLVAAYLQLEPGDTAKAKSKQADAINEALQCSPKVEDSKSRIDALEVAYTTYEQNKTLANAAAALGAAKNLTDFDRSIDWSLARAAPDKIAALDTATATYVRLIDRTVRLAPLYRANDPATIATADELAKVYEELRALPFADDPGLSAEQRRGIDAAVAARDAIAASERKLAILDEAFARRESDPVGLALALGALSPLDRARLAARANTTVNLKAAEAAARTSVGEAISRTAEAYRKGATYSAAQVLVQLADLAHDLGAAVPDASKAIVTSATQDLAGTTVRLDALRDAANQWQRVKERGQRDAAVESRIEQVIGAVVVPGSLEPNSFDAAAMTAQDRGALGGVIGAWVEIQGRVPPAQRRALTVTLQPPSNIDADARAFFSNVATQLERLGFTMSQSGKAALVLSLSAPGLQDGGINSQGLAERKASVTGALRWSYSGRTADMGTITGIGASRDKRELKDAALRSVAEQVARTVLSKVEGA